MYDSFWYLYIYNNKYINHFKSYCIRNKFYTVVIIVKNSQITIINGWLTFRINFMIINET